MIFSNNLLCVHGAYAKEVEGVCARGRAHTHTSKSIIGYHVRGYMNIGVLCRCVING